MDSHNFKNKIENKNRKECNMSTLDCLFQTCNVQYIMSLETNKLMQRSNDTLCSDICVKDWCLETSIHQWV